MIGARGRSDAAWNDADARAMHLLYAVCAAAFMAFAVWGSWFPFDFHRVPLSVASARFWSDWGTPPGTWSLTDLASNVLLFLPVGLFLAMAVEGQAARRTGAVTLGAMLLAIVALSAAVEFGQAFVSWRTPSIIDVVAEAAGAACGIAAAHLVGRECDALGAAALRILRVATTGERLLIAYVLAFGVAWLIPADFTLRPAEIGDKYSHKRLLLPFTPSPDAATPIALAATAVCAFPLGAAAVLVGAGRGARRSVASGAWLAGASLAALELAQVPVFSRTTDSTALLAAVAGAGGGAFAARFLDRPVVAALGPAAIRLSACLVLWLAVAAVSEWWPFHIALDADRARLETMRWSLDPFRWPSGAGALLRGVALAAAAGAFVRGRMSPDFIRVQTLLALACAGALFLAFEAGRVLLVGGRPTLVSVALKLGAVALGLFAWPVAATARVRGGAVR